MTSDLFIFVKYFYSYNNIFENNANAPFKYDNVI